MKRNLIILQLILTALFGHAQETIKPGDKIIRYDLIKPAHDFYKNVITDTSGNKVFEFMMENVSTIDRANKRITFARFRQVPVGSFSSDTSVTDLELKPVHMREIHQQRNVTYEMTFNADNVIVKTTKKSVLTSKQYAMKPGYFEDNMIEYIFGYLDLKKGITYRLNNFNLANSGSNPYQLEYVFDDIWKSPEDYKLNCRVIHFVNGDVSGYIWVDKNTRQVLKEIGTFKTGSFLLTKQ